MIITHKLMVCARIVVIACVVLLLLLTGFEAIPLSHYQTSYLLNADVQRVRSQILVKSALILEYRPIQEQPQAISDMQVVLPLFIAEQNVLFTSNHSDTQQSAQAGRSDYLAIVSAAQVLLSQALKNMPIDKTQVEIIVAHNRPYLAAQNDTVNIISNHVVSEQTFLFSVEMVFSGLLLIGMLGLLIGFEITHRRQWKATLIEKEQRVLLQKSEPLH